MDYIGSLNLNEHKPFEVKEICKFSIKQCSKCNKDRPLSSYCRNKYAKDGFNWICNNCRKKSREKVGQEKIQCSCGRMVYDNYLSKHCLTRLHKRNLEDVLYTGGFVRCF